MKKYILGLWGLFVLAGCAKDILIYKNEGTLLRIEPVATSWNEWRKSQVITTKGSWVVFGTVGAENGVGVDLEQHSEDDNRLCVGDRCYLIVH